MLSLNKLPVTLTFEEDITVDHFIMYRAQSHKSCHRKFNLSKLERARKKVQQYICVRIYIYIFIFIYTAVHIVYID